MQKQIDDRDGLVSFLDSCTLGEHSPNMLRVGLTVDKLLAMDPAMLAAQLGASKVTTCVLKRF